MIQIYTFCFWFSLRLGSILISAYSILKALWILIIILLTNNVDGWREDVEKFLENITFSIVVIKFIIENFRALFVSFIFFLCIYSFSGFLLAFGAFKVIYKLCLPFKYLHILFIIFDLFFLYCLFKYCMSLTFLPMDQQNQHRLGLIEAIFYLSFVVFYIYFDIYIQMCIDSFVKIVQELRKKVIKDSLLASKVIESKPAQGLIILHL